MAARTMNGSNQYFVDAVNLKAVVKHEIRGEVNYILFILPQLLWRLLDEEKLLHRELPGYAACCRRTRYRLIPSVW